MTGSISVPGGAAATLLTPDELARGYDAAARTLWCVAAGVLGRRDGAEDVLQESVMIALTKLETFDRATNLTAWLARIVRYVALNHARRHRRQAATPGDALLESRSIAPAPRAASPIRSDGVLNQDQSSFDDHVVAALDELDETPRACLLLRTTLDLPYREIARVLDIPEGTAMSHVHRARHSLGSRLESGPYRSRPSESRP